MVSDDYQIAADELVNEGVIHGEAYDRKYLVAGRVEHGILEFENVSSNGNGSVAGDRNQSLCLRMLFRIEDDLQPTFFCKAGFLVGPFKITQRLIVRR